MFESITSKLPVIIDNSNYYDEKTISILKEIPFTSNLKEVTMESAIQVNNIKNGIISYSLVDVPNAVYNGEIKSRYPIEGVRVIIYKDNREIVNKIILDGNTIDRQTNVNASIYSFEYDTPVSICVSVIFNSGYIRALLDSFIRDRNDHPREIATRGCYIGSCGGGGGGSPPPPPPPPNSYVSLFEHMKLTLTYNLTTSKNKQFFSFKGNVNEEKFGANTYVFSEKFKIPTNKFNRMVLGFNENIAADFAYYNDEWEYIENDPETHDGPCSRFHIVGDITKESKTEIGDHTHGELNEIPYVVDEVKENTINNSNVLLEMSLKNLINGITGIYSYNIFTNTEEDNITFINLNINIQKDENNYYIIVEYICKVARACGFENDILRIKSNYSLGVLLM